MKINDIRAQYEKDRNSVPQWMLSSPINNHLKSFENYMEWYKRNLDMFSPLDKAKNLL